MMELGLKLFQEGGKRFSRTSRTVATLLTTASLLGAIDAPINANAATIDDLKVAIPTIRYEGLAGVDFKYATTAKDLPGDPFEEQIPIYYNDVLDGTVADRSIIFLGEEDAEIEGRYPVIGVSETGEVLLGYTDEIYFDKENLIPIDDLFQYTQTYEVTADVLNVRDSMSTAPESLEGQLIKGQHVAGISGEREDEEGRAWIPILFPTPEGGLKQTYAAAAYLEPVDIKHDFAEQSLGMAPPTIEFVEDNSSIPNDEQSVVENKPNPFPKMFVDTSPYGFSALNIRSEKNTDSGNIIAYVPDGSVLDVISDDGEWCEVAYTNGNGDETIRGWAIRGFLKNNNPIDYIVSTPNGGPLNIRNKASLNSDVIGTVADGTHVTIQEENVNHPKSDGTHKWVKVQFGDGTLGFADLNYLKLPSLETSRESENQIFNVSSTLPENIKNIQPTREGVGFVGCDVAFMSPGNLRVLLTDQNAIPETGVYNGGQYTYNLKKFSGPIDFVGIRIGARGWGKAGNMVPFDNETIERIKVCEELGVPWTAYFFCQSYTIEEAEQEFQEIMRVLTLLKEKGLEPDLPFGIDVEYYNSEGRLNGRDVTDEVAYLMNKLKEHGIESMLYGDPTSFIDGLIDIPELSSMIGGEKVPVWAVNCVGTSGERINGRRKEALEKLSPYIRLVMEQALVDIETDGGYIDINTVNPETMIELLKGGRIQPRFVVQAPDRTVVALDDGNDEIAMN